MKVSRVWAFWLVLMGLGCALGAAGLDAPHSLHHAKSAERHLTEPHRAIGRHAAAKSGSTHRQVQRRALKGADVVFAQ